MELTRDPIIHYENFCEDVDPKTVILYNEDNSWSLRKLSNSTPSTMVFIQTLIGRVISKHNLYYLLQCDQYDTRNNDDIRITSVRWDGMIKGNVAGFFPSSIMVDVWNGKHIATKISQNNIQIAGIVKREMAETTVNYLVYQLLECLKFYHLCFNHTELFIEASKWLAAHSIGEEVIIKKGYNLRI